MCVCVCVGVGFMHVCLLPFSRSQVASTELHSSPRGSAQTASAAGARELAAHVAASRKHHASIDLCEPERRRVLSPTSSAPTGCSRGGDSTAARKVPPEEAARRRPPRSCRD